MDDSFGPVFGDGSDDGDRFDLTLLFEQSILTMLPGLAFLLIAPARSVFLARKENKTVPTSPRVWKLVCLYIQNACWVALCQLTYRVDHRFGLLCFASRLACSLDYQQATADQSFSCICRRQRHRRSPDHCIGLA